MDDSLDQGHAVWTADVDGDGAEEIIAGFRGPRHGGGSRAVDTMGAHWERKVIDEGIACQGMFAANLQSGGGVPAERVHGIVAIGGATHNVRLCVPDEIEEE